MLYTPLPLPPVLILKTSHLAIPLQAHPPLPHHFPNSSIYPPPQCSVSVRPLLPNSPFPAPSNPSPGDAHNEYEQAYDTSTHQPNEAKLSHEAVAGAASFAAFKAFEDKQRKEGKPVSHQFAKELLAGIAGAEVDRLAETKGMDFFDKEKAQHQAKQKTEQLYDNHYGGEQQWDPRREAPQEVRQYGNYGNNY